MSNSNSNNNIENAIKAAVERFNALTPEEQSAHRRAQRKSWVIGETMLERPNMSREEAERLYDSLDY
jgi:hypothetical protein